MTDYSIARLRAIFQEDGIFGLTRRVARKSKEIISRKYDLDNAYDENFFSYNLADSRPQAEWLASKIAHALGIKSMIDVGCATGHWVSAFHKAGVDAYGIEGSIAAKDQLVCPPERVVFLDLRRALVARANTEYDLVMSIEVAEHIEAKYADVYISNLVSFNPKWIFITAATPGQGGHYHVNEQPSQYWIERFQRFDYVFDKPTKEMISGFVVEGKALKSVPPIMQNPNEKHDGVWIPDWMPKNLLTFRSSRYSARRA